MTSHTASPRLALFALLALTVASCRERKPALHDGGTPDAPPADAFVCPDVDGDGYPAAACGGGDCDDTNAQVHPGATEVCNGGVDDNCNGLADAADGACVQCPLGFEGFDHQCLDLDECGMGTDDCDRVAGAICNNTRGGFTCACPVGVGGNPHVPGTCNGPRFTDLGGGVVQDNNGSGLRWQQIPSTGTYTQAEAIAYCPTITLDGGGWRLPTQDELSSLIDLRFTAPTIDSTYFPGTPSSTFWSSSVYNMFDPSEFGEGVDFRDGFAGHIPPSFSFVVRCVR